MKTIFVVQMNGAVTHLYESRADANRFVRLRNEGEEILARRQCYFKPRGKWTAMEMELEPSGCMQPPFPGSP